MELKHKTNLLRLLPAPTDAARGVLATWVIRALTSHLAATRGKQHPPDRLIRHAVFMRDVTERFSLLDTLEHDCPCRGRDLPARIRSGVRGGQAEIKASDGQGQRRTDQLVVRKYLRVPGRPGDHLCQRTAFQEGCEPGATDSSIPVGSVSIIYSSF